MPPVWEEIQNSNKKKSKRKVEKLQQMQFRGGEKRLQTWGHYQLPQFTAWGCWDKFPAPKSGDAEGPRVKIIVWSCSQKSCDGKFVHYFKPRVSAVGSPRPKREGPCKALFY